MCLLDIVFRFHEGVKRKFRYHPLRLLHVHNDGRDRRNRSGAHRGRRNDARPRRRSGQGGTRLRRCGMDRPVHRDQPAALCPGAAVGPCAECPADARRPGAAGGGGLGPLRRCARGHPAAGRGVGGDPAFAPCGAGPAGGGAVADLQRTRGQPCRRRLAGRDARDPRGAGGRRPGGDRQPQQPLRAVVRARADRPDRRDRGAPAGR